ncbi:MAG: hypothetical protein JST69_14355 [Bacteroidetes bacterium]|nr:hypothetical protein [Bacteroidota bacterium]
MICKDCASVQSGSAEVISTFSGRFFKFGLNAQFQPQLFALDTAVNKIATPYGFCNFLSDQEILQTDIIRANGHVYAACNKVDSFLVVNTYTIPTTCAPKPIYIANQFSLTDRQWLMDTLKVNGQIYLPPCGYSPSIYFGGNGQYKVSQVVNTITGNFSTVGIDSIHLGTSYLTLGLAITPYQRDFENHYTTAVGVMGNINARMKFILTGNQLTLETQNGQLKFYCKQ